MMVLDDERGFGAKIRYATEEPKPTHLDDRKTWENTGNARGKKRVIGNKGGKAELPDN
jgi:hypothetical protein